MQITKKKAAHKWYVWYLPKTEEVYFWPTMKYSIIIVNTTVVRLRVVYMGTFTPRIDSITASFSRRKDR